MNIAPHAPNAATEPDAENKTSMKQLINGKEYPVIKGDVIKKGFDRESDFERCVTYLHGIYQLPGCTRYTGDRITSCTCLQILPIENNAMLGAVQFMVYFRGMHFNEKKDLYINIQKHASIFYRETISTINGEGHGRCYVLPTSVCATKNNDLPTEDI